MKATTWIDWERVTLEFGASAIEEVIARCGWTIVNGFTEMTDANRAELARIEEQGYAEIVTLPAFQAKAWWDAHVAARVSLAELLRAPGQV
jgi:hypothetical protein